MTTMNQAIRGVRDELALSDADLADTERIVAGIRDTFAEEGIVLDANAWRAVAAACFVIIDNHDCRRTADLLGVCAAIALEAMGEL